MGNSECVGIAHSYPVRRAKSWLRPVLTGIRWAAPNGVHRSKFSGRKVFGGAHADRTAAENPSRRWPARLEPFQQCSSSA